MSRFVTTETSKARVCFVNVPDDANPTHVSQAFNKEYLCTVTDKGKCTSIELPKGQWKPLGTGDLNEVTEEQAASVVDACFNAHNEKGYKLYEDTIFDAAFISSCESIKSLARSLGIPEDKKTIVLFTLK